MGKYRIVAFSILSASCIALAAQLNLPVRTIGGEEYYYRQVKKKETIYGISKELGIKKDDIVKYNPSVAAGLQKDQILYFPVSVFGNAEDNPRPESHNHYVKKGETLYGIAKMYGISVADLTAANPEVRYGLKAGTTLAIPSAKVEIDGKQGTPYVVKPGDTLYRLSVNFEVDLKDLLAMNPGVSPENFKAGMTILIPPADKNFQTEPDTVFLLDKAERGDSFESIADEYNVEESDLREANPEMNKPKRGNYVAVPITNEINEDSLKEKEKIAYTELTETPNSDEIRIAMLLPMEASSASPAKQALLYRDFYRGFLLAINDLADKGARIRLTVRDINEYNIHSTLDRNDIRDANIIFAPGEDNLLQEIAQFGQENDINIINAFAINNELFFENDRLFQLNTPSSYMYSAVQEYIEKTFDGYQIIFLKKPNSEDKPLIAHLKLAELPKHVVNIEETDSFVCTRKTLFIPTSSDKDMLAQTKAFIEKVESNPENSGKYALFGYPEWTIYYEYDDFLKHTGAYLFSRFVMDSTDELDKEYHYWFGDKPINSLPQMNALGYELAKYFIETLEKNHNDFNAELPSESGSQIGIHLTRSSNWGGFVNTASFIFHYRRNGIDKIMIK